MTKTIIEQWVEQSEDHKRLYQQEGLILDVSEHIYELLDKYNLEAKDLAARLKVSKARVSKMLDGTSNLTLRTLSDIAFALGEEVSVSFNANSGVVAEEPVAVTKRQTEEQWITQTWSRLHLIQSNDNIAITSRNSEQHDWEETFKYG